MSRRVASLLACAAGAATALAAPAAAAYCPCYTASSAFNQYGCAIEAAPGTNPTTAEWNPIFDLVSRGPAFWGDAGPTVDDIGQGCGKPEPIHDVPARFPCELLKGITMQESGWRQFCEPDLPDDQVGLSSRTIISFDCGYGIGQVTSGMHFGENPDFDRDRVAADPTYNLATGTRILADKWRATNCVGDNQPAVVEHWYTATWAYNGLAYVNNPNNPNYDPGRGVWDPQVGGGAPYQEKVFGWIEHTGGMWDPTALAYPNPGEIGGASSPPELLDPSCASPTDCANTRSIHTTVCDGEGGGGGAGGGSSGPGGGAAAGGAGPGPGGGDPGAGGGAGEGGVGFNEDDGPMQGSCSCRTAGGAGAEGAAWLGVLLAALGVARGRRRSSSATVPGQLPGGRGPDASAAPRSRR